MKYLILNFRNAKLFRKYNKDGVNFTCKDYVFDNNEKWKQKKRDFFPSFIEPITVHQISNMLHVLFNERPVPSFRTVYYPRNDYYFNMAQNSFLKIDTPKKENGDFYREIMHVKKAVPNAWSKTPCINWEIIRRYIDDKEKFDVIISELNRIFNQDVLKIPVITLFDMVQELSENLRLNFYEIIKAQKRIDGLIYCFGRYKNGEFQKPDISNVTNKKNKTARLVNSGLEKVTVLSGQILVPVTEDDIKRLETISKGCATILDGGIVWIDSVKHENVISDEDFIPVNTISDKKTIPAKI